MFNHFAQFHIIKQHKVDAKKIVSKPIKTYVKQGEKNVEHFLSVI